ncbi:hypothetical protein CSIM01_03392 [Colletotrichum simmondsii]|uniref:Uncharacterized protein n=1 Tax=Colletotrichum simmondsii TaxID=703756 RepID=A0A135SZ68_9PEZI|nr:hypothetical protein CSIM01_03392 [Colletotrichum simmondsii]
MPSQRYRLADPEHDPTTMAPLSLSNGGYEKGDGGLHKTGVFEAAPRRLRKLTKPSCNRAITLPRSTLNAMISESLRMRRYSRESTRGTPTEAASRFEARITTSFG